MGSWEASLNVHGVDVSKASGPQSSRPGTPVWHCRKTDAGILSGTPGSEERQHQLVGGDGAQG